MVGYSRLQALHSKSVAKARQGAHFWASMMEEEEGEEEEGEDNVKEGLIEFASIYHIHIPNLVEGLVASLVCLAEAGDLPGRPADCLTLLCRCPFYITLGVFFQSLLCLGTAPPLLLIPSSTCFPPSLKARTLTCAVPEP